MDEFVVFISVKIDNLNDFSNSISKIVRIEVSVIKDKIKINNDKKYFEISELLKFSAEYESLFIKIFFGLVRDVNSLIENLNNE